VTFLDLNQTLSYKVRRENSYLMSMNPKDNQQHGVFWRENPAKSSVFLRKSPGIELSKALESEGINRRKGRGGSVYIPVDVLFLGDRGSHAPLVGKGMWE
jgi:hypothetical protein